MPVLETCVCYNYHISLNLYFWRSIAHLTHSHTDLTHFTLSSHTLLHYTGWGLCYIWYPGWDTGCCITFQVFVYVFYRRSEMLKHLYDFHNWLMLIVFTNSHCYVLCSCSTTSITMFRNQATTSIKIPASRCEISGITVLNFQRVALLWGGTLWFISNE